MFLPTFLLLLFQGNQHFIEYLDRLSKKIDVPQMVLMDLKEDYTLLDARELEEFSTSNIEGAHFVGYDDFKMIEDCLLSDTIVVYCSVGYRSSKIVQNLKDKGYKNVYNLYGGIFNWVNNNNPVISNNKITNKVHTYNKKWSKYIYNKSVIKIYD